MGPLYLYLNFFLGVLSFLLLLQDSFSLDYEWPFLV